MTPNQRLPFDLKQLHHSIDSIHAAFCRQEIGAEELTLEYLSRIRASHHNAFLCVTESQAVELARQADRRLRELGSEVALARYPLLGIPVALKDNLQWEGVETTCASRILQGYVSPFSATVVQKLLDAGAVILGKTNLDEFAMGGSNENSAYGPVLHPTHLDRVPGGSSGGSATAVGVGLCVVALGTDTGGSIRLPASYCGISGFKPSYGRVSRYGLVAFASSLDQVGPMARSMKDCARVHAVLAGVDPKDATTREFKVEPDLKRPIRLGVPHQFFGQGLSPDVSQVVKSAIQKLESLGAEVHEVSFDYSDAVISTYYLLAVSEASSNLSRFDGVRFGRRPLEAENVLDLDSFYKKVRSQFGPEVKRRILFGAFALSSGHYDAYYRKAGEVRELIRANLDQIFEEVDLIVGPVAPTTAYPLGSKTRDPLEMYLNDLYTIPANLAGLPALSLPIGVESQTGLPIGLQLQAQRGQDQLLLDSAIQWEDVFKDQQKEGV